MDIDRALAMGDAEATILRTVVIALFNRHPERAEMLREIEQQVAEQMIESARTNHSPHFRSELRTLWQLWRPKLGTG